MSIETAELPEGWDPYEELGIQHSAGVCDVKTAFRRLARLYHPDKVGRFAQDGKQDFIRVRLAYEILSDSERRAALDAGGGLSEISLGACGEVDLGVCAAVGSFDKLPGALSKFSVMPAVKTCKARANFFVLPASFPICNKSRFQLSFSSSSCACLRWFLLSVCILHLAPSHFWDHPSHAMACLLLPLCFFFPSAIFFLPLQFLKDWTQMTWSGMRRQEYTHMRADAQEYTQSQPSSWREDTTRFVAAAAHVSLPVASDYL